MVSNAHYSNMSAPETIAEAISLVATSPKRTKVKSTEVEEHDLQSLIAADNHLKSQTAGNKNHLGLRFIKMIPPGAG